jgi:hypothetical protein
VPNSLADGSVIEESRMRETAPNYRSLRVLDRTFGITMVLVVSTDEGQYRLGADQIQAMKSPGGLTDASFF